MYEYVKNTEQNINKMFNNDSFALCNVVFVNFQYFYSFEIVFNIQQPSSSVDTISKVLLS